MEQLIGEVNFDWLVETIEKLQSLEKENVSQTFLTEVICFLNNIKVNIENTWQD